MKLVGRHIERDRSGYVNLRPEDDEDMWHLYNLIQQGDEVRAPAIRRVQNETATGSTSSQRVRTNLTLTVDRMHFSAAVSSNSTGSTSAAAGATAGGASGSGSTASSSQGASLQITGQVAVENRYVKMGAYHTLDLEANRDIRITKAEWDSVALDRVHEACQEGRGAEVGAIVCGEGTAALCLVSEHMTVIRQRIDSPVPRKRTGSTTLHEKGLARFYETLYQSFLRHIPYQTLRVIVIASPGFVRDAVYEYIFAQATKTNNKPLLQARSKFVLVHVNSPHVHSLMEVLNSPQISSQVKETKFAREGATLDRFHKMLATDERRAWYGPRDVALAAERGAIGTLLISDTLFRSSDVKERKVYVKLVESVRRKGSEVVIFSSMHESGEQLNQLTGIAAILNFPLDIEVVEAEERVEKEEELKRLEAESTQSESEEEEKHKDKGKAASHNGGLTLR